MVRIVKRPAMITYSVCEDQNHGDWFWVAVDESDSSVAPRTGHADKFIDAVKAAYGAATEMSSTEPTYADSRSRTAERYLFRADPLAPVRGVLCGYAERVPLWWATKWGACGEPLAAAYEKSDDVQTILTLSNGAWNTPEAMFAVTSAVRSAGMSVSFSTADRVRVYLDAQIVYGDFVLAHPAAAAALRRVLPPPPALSRVMTLHDLCGRYEFIRDTHEHRQEEYAAEKSPFERLRELCLAGDEAGAREYAERAARERMET